MIPKGLKDRRSIRKYKVGEVVSDEQIKRLLEAAMLAPSACNTRPWEFIVVKNRDKLDEIMNVHPYVEMLRTASLAIIVCALPKVQEGRPGQDMWPQDCAAATENILLAAHGMGYGAVWLGIYPRPERIVAMKDLLSLPPHIHAFSIIAVGNPDQVLPQPERFHPERIHLNKW